jgi:hypothetical protein
MRAGYTYADRNIDGSYQAAPASQFFEWDQLRMFDQAERERYTVYTNVNVDPMDGLSLALAFNYMNDDYEGKYYGLQDQYGYISGLDASYVISERATFFAHYSREDAKTKLRAKSDAAGGGSFAIPENDWTTTVNDTTNTLGGTLSLDLIPEKLSFELGYDYSHSRSEFDSGNPRFVPGTTTSSATAYDWEDIESKTTQIRAELTYNFTEQLSTNFRYLYERFSLHDPFTRNVSPYGNATDIQGNTLDYFVFMDSNLGDYDANLFTFTVKYEF